MTDYNKAPFANDDNAYKIGMLEIEKTALEKGNILNVVNERGRDLSMNDPIAFEIVSTLVLQFERHDPGMLSARAALRGAVTGLLVAEATYGSAVSAQEYLAAIDIRDNIKSNDDSTRRAVNDMLIDIGNAGFQMLETDDNLIDQWSTTCVDDVSLHYYYRLGLGLVMMSSKKAAHRKVFELLDEELATTEYDWDQAFIDMKMDEK